MTTAIIPKKLRRKNEIKKNETTKQTKEELVLSFNRRKKILFISQKNCRDELSVLTAIKKRIEE
jgi:hypothetical protein